MSAERVLPVVGRGANSHAQLEGIVLPDRPYTSRAKRSLELADAAANTLGHPYIGTEHILLGLLDEQRGPAAQILDKLGVTSDIVRREVQALMDNR